MQETRQKPYIKTAAERAQSYLPVSNTHDAWCDGECDQGENKP